VSTRRAVNSLTVERRGSREEHVADDPQRPDIAPVVVITRQHLRGGVVTGADPLIHSLVEIEVFAQTKVNHDQGRGGGVALKEKIFKFQITMDNSFAVEVVNAGEHVAHETSCTIFTKDVALVFARGQQLIELPTPA
jgi:hypothetical protein